MILTIIIYSKDPEVAWNACRIANFSIKQGDTVKIFLLGDGVESEYVEHEKYNAIEELKKFRESGGELFVCGTCLSNRQIDTPRFGIRASLAHLHELISGSERVITF